MSYFLDAQQLGVEVV